MNLKYKNYMNIDNGWSGDLSEAYLSINNAYFIFNERFKKRDILHERYDVVRIIYNSLNYLKFSVKTLEEFQKALFKNKEAEVLYFDKLNLTPNKYIIKNKKYEAVAESLKSVAIQDFLHLYCPKAKAALSEKLDAIAVEVAGLENVDIVNELADRIEKNIVGNKDVMNELIKADALKEKTISDMCKKLVAGIKENASDLTNYEMIVEFLAQIKEQEIGNAINLFNNAIVRFDNRAEIPLK